MSFFGNDDPYRHKTQKIFCTWSVRVCVQNFTVVRHGILQEIGHRQNKQTLKYLVDFNDEQKLFSLLQLYPDVAHNSLMIPRVFHVQRNSSEYSKFMAILYIASTWNNLRTARWSLITNVFVVNVLGSGLEFVQNRVMDIFIMSVECRPALWQQRPLELVVMEIASLMTRHTHQQHVMWLVLFQQRREMPGTKKSRMWPITGYFIDSLLMQTPQTSQPIIWLITTKLNSKHEYQSTHRVQQKIIL